MPKPELEHYFPSRTEVADAAEDDQRVGLETVGHWVSSLHQLVDELVEVGIVDSNAKVRFELEQANLFID